ncbi:MAG TPA: MOSC domain-containing protein [Candidatus Dormibacteraeota bacterium]|nr:MOSC domain-containing protein [Candidatus Dormibacteraeota bacterium]
MSKVLHLFRAPAKRVPMAEMAEIQAIADAGFEGCAHARPRGQRQVLLMASERLAEFGLRPGIVRENITTQGIDVDALVTGQQVRVGGALLEVSIRCEPCDQMETIRVGLKQALKGKRGTLCRVMEAGRIRQGDTIEVVIHSPAETGALAMND